LPLSGPLGGRGGKKALCRENQRKNHRPFVILPLELNWETRLVHFRRRGGEKKRSPPLSRPRGQKPETSERRSIVRGVPFWGKKKERLDLPDSLLPRWSLIFASCETITTTITLSRGEKKNQRKKNFGGLLRLPLRAYKGGGHACAF